jgi:hypothetical protein
MPADKPVAALLVPEDHQVFAHQPHGLDRAVADKLVDQSGRLPIPPQQCPGSRSGAGAGDEVVLFRAEHRGFHPVR